MNENCGPVVIFDGVCHLCAYSVAFVLAHERDHAIRFAAAQSATGNALLLKLGLNPESSATFVFIDNDRAYVRSDAVLEVVSHLRLPWRILRLFRVIPRPLCDRLYDFIAQRRYRWFGKRESCLVPSPEFRSRFMDI